MLFVSYNLKFRFVNFIDFNFPYFHDIDFKNLLFLLADPQENKQWFFCFVESEMTVFFVFELNINWEQFLFIEINII